jgi:hypothetical protein
MGTLRAKMTLARRNNTAANLDVLLLADVDDFVLLNTPVLTPDPDNIEIAADHTFGVADGFSVLEPSYKTLRSTGTSSEEADSDGERIELLAFYPGEKADIIKDVKNMKKGRFIALKHDPDTAGEFVQYGRSSYEYVRLKNYSYTDGDPLGRKGYELVFEALVTSKFIYTGQITYKP